MGFKVFSCMVGQLLLRTLDRARRIHLAMLCRGFDGEIRVVRALEFRAGDFVFLAACSALFLVMRLYDIPQWLGHMVMELVR
jgi:cobalt/nickel transport system permease protein